MLLFGTYIGNSDSFSLDKYLVNLGCIFLGAIEMLIALFSVLFSVMAPLCSKLRVLSRTAATDPPRKLKMLPKYTVADTFLHLAKLHKFVKCFCLFACICLFVTENLENHANVLCSLYQKA